MNITEPWRGENENTKAKQIQHTQVTVHPVHSIYECFNTQQPASARALLLSLAQHQTPWQARQKAE